MTGWDILNSIINYFPPVAGALLLAAAGIILIIGFTRHGMNFIKYGFKQTMITDFLSTLATKEDINKLDTRIGGVETRIAGLETRIGGMETRIESLETRLGGMETRIEAIETNHFRHLKNFLTELTSILVDKGIINNENKARLDNHLQGM